MVLYVKIFIRFQNNGEKNFDKSLLQHSIDISRREYEKDWLFFFLLKYFLKVLNPLLLGYFSYI